MSSHLLLDRPGREIRLGWDRPLQSFFGVVLDDGEAVAGWPCETGLDFTHRPVTDAKQAAVDLASLLGWARGQIPDELAAHPMAEHHLGRVMNAIHREWREGQDMSRIPLPACLQGART